MSSFQAIEQGDLDGVRNWFDEGGQRYPGFNINKVVDSREGKEKNLKSNVYQKRMTALNYAAFHGSLKIVDFLLQSGAGTM